MIINFEHEFIYLAMPHTASRAISTALLKLESSTTGDLPHHAFLRNAQDAFFEDFKDFKVFYSVRHPGDWLVSRWHANGGVRADFPEWIRQRDKHLFGRFHKETENHVRYEELERDLKLMTGHEVKLLRDPTHTTTDKRIWQDYWTQEDAEWAESYFRDFELYGYSMEGLNSST